MYLEDFKKSVEGETGQQQAEPTLVNDLANRTLSFLDIYGSRRVRKELTSNLPFSLSHFPGYLSISFLWGLVRMKNPLLLLTERGYRSQDREVDVSHFGGESKEKTVRIEVSNCSSLEILDFGNRSLSAALFTYNPKSRGIGGIIFAKWINHCEATQGDLLAHQELLRELA